MNNDIFLAALAGLLHDIGKLARRAGEKGSRAWDTQAEQAYGEPHALHSGDFVEKYVPEPWAKSLSGPARHHRPQTHHDRVVALANRLSAGEQSDPGQQEPQQMLSIFCNLAPPDEQGGVVAPPQGQYLPLAPLRIQEAVIFPSETPGEAGRAYEDLWREFTTEAGRLKEVQAGPEADPVTYLNSLLKLMQRLCWAVPSAYYGGRPDVSLYDHSRMAAALAACLVERPEAEVEAMLNTPGQATPAALLVGGDISGVQKFIYTITSRGATSGLRGRSMYLQLLTEVAARYVLNTLGLPLTNLIYGGGGHFYLLAPVAARERLPEIRRAISRILLQHHQGDLYLALESVPLPANAFHGPTFSGRWQALTQALQEAKQQQFAEMDEASLQRLFAPQEHGGNEEKMCAVTQREHPGTQRWGDEEVRKSPPTRSYEELGDDLRRATYLCLDQLPPTPLEPGQPEGGYKEVLAHFGYQAGFHRDQPPAMEPQTLRRNLLVLRDEALAEVGPQTRQTMGRHPLVNVTPVLSRSEYETLKEEQMEDLPPPNSVKPFQVMAWQAEGIKRLGVLRMDVDNLGKIFSEGLGEKATLSRVASLSFAMSLFFEGWVGEIARRANEAAGQDLIYSIYSGGDDLFFVGAWNLMPLLAEQISRDLERYSGGHPGIHTSGGITLVPEKYPLYQAADDALEAEAAAKASYFGGQRKNALHFLGKTIPWPKFGEVKEHHERLRTLVDPEGDKRAVPRNLIHRLSQLYLMYEESQQKQAEQGRLNQVYWGPGQWLSAYSLSRLAEQHKHAREEIIAIRDALSLENFANIEWIGPAARWVELLIRKGV